MVADVFRIINFWYKALRCSRSLTVNIRRRYVQLCTWTFTFPNFYQLFSFPPFIFLETDFTNNTRNTLSWNFKQLEFWASQKIIRAIKEKIYWFIECKKKIWQFNTQGRILNSLSICSTKYIYINILNLPFCNVCFHSKLRFSMQTNTVYSIEIAIETVKIFWNHIYF